MKANVRNMIKAIVDDHIQTFYDGYKRDLVDAFIGKIKEAEDPKSSFFGKRGRTNLEQNMLELFGAGANPVATASPSASSILPGCQRYRTESSERYQTTVVQSLSSLWSISRTFLTQMPSSMRFSA